MASKMSLLILNTAFVMTGLGDLLRNLRDWVVTSSIEVQRCRFCHQGYEVIMRRIHTHGKNPL